MSITPKLLAQVRPTNTSNTLAFTATKKTIIKQIIVSNSGAAVPLARIFHDAAAGSTYDETTQIAWDVPIDAGWPLTPIENALMNAGGQIAVRTDTANDLTFTIYGLEID